MPLAFCASQQLQLRVVQGRERLADYLSHEQRVVHALLDPRQLQTLGPGRYRYTVTPLQVFQLRIQPVVELRTQYHHDRLELQALDCHLEGLGLVDDFELSLDSWLVATDNGLNGQATLAVRVSQPPLLRLIPARVLEATGQSLLAGILLGIKSRVGQQLLADFESWYQESPPPTPAAGA
jgi:hypothetical protein